MTCADRELLKERIRLMLGRMIGKPIAELDERSRMIDDLGFESVQIVQLFSEIQTEFKINLSADDYVLENVADVGSIVQTVANHLPIPPAF